MGCESVMCQNVSGGVPGTTQAIPSPDLSPETAARIATHPCYSEQAHYRYARMHLAVAPGCNIQCNYCNRKYDCANESRPGVTSERLTPEQAAAKVRAVRQRIPRLSVVGIAGPGDPLAVPERTFRTFELVARIDPALQLCVSTNGLMLAESIEKIKAANIQHVTVTVNAIDPIIGAEIYAWVYHNRRRYAGRDGAALLLDRQMQGLELLRSNGILCKVNSVLIPGINDAHMLEVNREVTLRGAFLHNVMPLISAPEHGTHFGLNGVRGPTDEELREVQSKLVGGVKLMRHCRQCRADAVGLLGQDRSAEFTLERLGASGGSETSMKSRREKLRVAVATTGDGIINEHFGQVERFQVYDVDESGVRLIASRETDFYCLGGAGDGKALSGILRLLQDCRAVFVAKIGPCPRKTLSEAGLQPVEEFADRPIEASLVEYYELVSKEATGDAFITTKGERAWRL